jgi:phage protein D
MSMGFDILHDGMVDPALPLASRVEIVEEVGCWTTYRLHYSFNIQEGDLALLTYDQIRPEREIAVRVLDGVTPAILVRGPVVQHDIDVLSGGEGSMVTVSGGDLTVAMGRECRVRNWPSTTDAAAAIDVLGDHSLAPMVDLPNTVVHEESHNSLLQRESDLQFVRRIARRNGCWFWLTYDPLGMATAHLKRPPVGEAPSADLIVNGTGCNVQLASLHVNFERPVMADAMHFDGGSLETMNGDVDRSPLTGLATYALADIVTSARRSQLSVPVDDTSDLIARSQAALIDAGWFVTAKVTARQSVLGKILRANTVVNLNGIGSRHSGKYLVARVAHDIGPGDDIMTVTLTRNGWN